MDTKNCQAFCLTESYWEERQVPQTVIPEPQSRKKHFSEHVASQNGVNLLPREKPQDGERVLRCSVVSLSWYVLPSKTCEEPLITKLYSELSRDSKHLPRALSKCPQAQFPDQLDMWIMENSRSGAKKNADRLQKLAFFFFPIWHLLIWTQLGKPHYLQSSEGINREREKTGERLYKWLQKATSIFQ